MTTSKKYYTSQFLAIIVTVISLTVGSLVGGYLSSLVNIYPKITSLIFICGVIVILLKINYLILGSLLIKFKLLPEGSEHVYPDARSWNDYEYKVAKIRESKQGD